jgi:multidrug transporter EmrE-like cation transporter
MTILPLVLAILATAVAQVLFKLYFVRKKFVYLVTTVATFCMAPAMNYLALKDYSLSTVYMATGLTYVLVLVLANALLHETIDRRKTYSMLLIVGGTVVFNL